MICMLFLEIPDESGLKEHEKAEILAGIARNFDDFLRLDHGYSTVKLVNARICQSYIEYKQREPKFSNFSDLLQIDGVLRNLNDHLEIDISANNARGKGLSGSVHISKPVENRQLSTDDAG